MKTTTNTQLEKIKTLLATPPSFDVLAAETDIHRNYVLEASAGTGKTFSIEHIIARLLVEGEGIPLENILVVTFTKAATRDLKRRIRNNIEQALAYVGGHQDEGPPYLEPFLGCRQARRRLEEALYTFDQANITTIHGFCSRMLADHPFESGIFNADTTLPNREIRQVIKNFFRTEMHQQLITPAQLRLVFKGYGPDSDALENNLLRTITRGLPIDAPPPAAELLHAFGEAMRTLKERYQLSAKKYRRRLLPPRPRVSWPMQQTETNQRRGPQ